MLIRLLAAIIAVVPLVAFAAGAQERCAISGTVLDAVGTPMPGVAVQLTGPESRRAVSDRRGAFVFGALLPGAYQVRFELGGFTPATQSATVSPGATARVTARLAAAPMADAKAAQEAVRVQGVTAAPPPSPSVVGATSQLYAGAAGGRGLGRAPADSWTVPGPREPFEREAYDRLDENPFRRVGVDPLSTFSVDVDTASYANVRRFLNDGQLPPAGAVRIEELVNYFRFDYPQPTGDAPFSVTTELAEAPWNPKHRLALIGLQGRSVSTESLPARNLVFLIDVSGSMQSPDKLPLVRTGLRMLVDTLTARDHVALVVYAGSSGLVLPSTSGDQKERIHQAIAALEAGGSTNGGAGIRLAYTVAREHFVRGGVNRVVLASDGDFNVGTTSQDELIRLIETERASGVFLSVLGVGTGNLNDSTMEKLADKGNGNYSYLDSLHEARKVLVQEAGGTLVTIAKDVKIQVEFNPRTVAGYRLIGYENRMLRHEDFNDDKKDAGEIGAGHSVTALYEIVPVGVPLDAPGVDPLKYQTPPATTGQSSSGELLTVKLRYKAPDGDESRLLSSTIGSRTQAMTANLGFASAVAEVGMLLRGSTHAPGASYTSALARARSFRRDDPEGYRAEFIKLGELAASLRRIE